MKPKLKIGNITSLEQARTAASLGPDYIGLRVSATDQNAISPIALPEIMNWIPDCIHVAEVTNYSADNLENLGELLGIRHFQTADDLNIDESSNLTLFRDVEKGGSLPEKGELVCEHSSFAQLNTEEKKRCLVTISPQTSAEDIETISKDALGFNVKFLEETSFDDWENLLSKLDR